MLMYLLFIFLSVAAFPLILFSYKEVDSYLFGIGALEVAFGFYAFGAGNAAYSACPSFKREVREKVWYKAKEIIGAARRLVFGGILLVVTGFTVRGSGATSLTLLIHLTLVAGASMLVICGARKLCRNLPWADKDFMLKE